mmetsp:Transcript_31797/g.70620  ORF Transcript_31797/g.70620 Transcript_31797/m.70620 type:complete len:150 (+) Transcript_31797:110-559(+)
MSAPTQDLENQTQPLLPNSTETKDVEHWTKRTARSLYASITHVGASLLFGLVTAICLKSVGQTLAIALVLLFIGFQVLAYYGFVNFKWSSVVSNVGSGLSRTMDINNDGRVDLQDVRLACTSFWKWVISWGVLSVAGFALGFYLGWKLL